MRSRNILRTINVIIDSIETRTGIISFGSFGSVLYCISGLIIMRFFQTIKHQAIDQISLLIENHCNKKPNILLAPQE